MRSDRPFKKKKSVSLLVFICISLQFITTGECWSGDNGENTFAKDGPSNFCTDQCYQPCQPYSEFCVGGNFANYVYKISRRKIYCLSSTKLIIGVKYAFTKCLCTNHDGQNIP